ncbi:MAG: hypothetical protein EOL97_01390 [Spirochaetia bacterium]|nr:hypothetical protein [Spirochaetia bacterium]
MIKKILLAMIYINLSLLGLFSTNVSLTNNNLNKNLKIDISDKFNNVSIKFENNKIVEVNSLKLSINNILIKKEKIQLNEQVIVDNSLRYIISFNYNLFKISSTIPSFSNDKIDIKIFELNYNNLIFQTSYYYNYSNLNNKFYYDFSNLLYTKNGYLFYLEYEFKNISTKQELGITNLGTNYSSIYALNLKHFTFSFNVKNINEKYTYKVIFNHGNFKYESIDKIYDISIYGGQGIKRNRQVKSKLKLNYDINNFQIMIYLNFFTEIDYDVYLKKTINKDFKIRTIIRNNENEIELSLNYNNNFAFYFIFNNVKINFSNNIFDIQYNFKNKNNYSCYNIKLNSNRELEIKYQRFL